MLAEEKIRNGDPQGALEALQTKIRSQPDHSDYRIFYFQLLTILGRWKAALNQLNVLENLARETMPMVQTYRAAIQCEVLRQEIFAGRQTPLIFGEPPAWMALMVESLRLTALENHPQALELRHQAFDQAQPSSGAIDDHPFQWIADADCRLGPVLELILNGRYYWTPLEQVKIITITPPEDLRDLVWLPAQFVFKNGQDNIGFIPTRYPGSENAEDDALKLARTTKWYDVGNQIFHGLGQRMLATDQNDYPLLETRLVRFN